MMLRPFRAAITLSGHALSYALLMMPDMLRYADMLYATTAATSPFRYARYALRQRHARYDAYTPPLLPLPLRRHAPCFVSPFLCRAMISRRLLRLPMLPLRATLLSLRASLADTLFTDTPLCRLMLLTRCRAMLDITATMISLSPPFSLHLMITPPLITPAAT